MSAMENMVRTLLRAMDIPVDDVKREVTTRIAQFEANINTLNNTLISTLQTLEKIEQRLDRIELNLKALMEAQNLEYITPTASEGKSNGSNNRGSLPLIA